jgi:branched-chain amino acid transport system permease protein
MTTAVAMAGSAARDSVRRHLGPFIFLGVAAVADFLLIGPAQFLNGLTSGAIIALVALGYTMVYGIIELINFAHGDVFMVSVFASIFVLNNVLGVSGPSPEVLQTIVLLILTFLIVMPVVGLLGVIIERIAYRPLRNAPRLAPLLTAIGVSFILQNVIQIIYGPSPVNVPQVIPPQAVALEVGSLSIRWINLLVIVTSIVLMIGLQLFVNRTRLGRAMRSTAQDREAAALMGVDINRTIAITFLIGSALAGAAGVVYGQLFGNVQFNLGFKSGLIAFTAAVLGGIGNITGAAVGGFVIGFIQTTMAAKGLFVWNEAAVFAVLIGVLLFRPAGLFGTPLGERA